MSSYDYVFNIRYEEMVSEESSLLPAYKINYKHITVEKNAFNQNAGNLERWWA